MAKELFERSKKDHLDYLHDQYKKGLLDDSSLSPLIEAGYISAQTYKPTKEHLGLDTWYEKQVFKYAGSDTIYKEQWCPKSITKHTPEFYNFINSITLGFFTEALSRISYKPYELYKAQAIRWLMQETSPANHVNDDRKREVIREEFKRCKENTMYFAVKYCYVKESADGTGKIRYKPKEHNCFLFFMLDCGYSLLIGKPRQIYSSTTMGIYALKKCLFQKNFFMKFIAEDETTVNDIFADKIKYPFAELPAWMRPNILSDRYDNFWVGQKEKKGEIKGQNSRISVVPPSRTAINGGSPQLVFIDEIGNIPILTEMITEAWPTMFIDKYGDGNLEFKRQIVAWGTGVSDNKGKGAFQREWYRILGLWEEKNKQAAFVPIFLSWHTRCDAKHYKEQKAVYYGGKNLENGIDLETNKKMFHQHYPANFKDMFMVTSSTLVGKELIDEGIFNITKLPHEQRPVAGYFEPIYDYTRPENDNSDVPYRIVDANFIPCNDDEMGMATAWRLLPPDYEWRNRYYSGVDPIAVETGHSKFASVVWDKKVKAPVCIVNFRKQHDHKYCFLQAMLMNIYYDTNHTQNNKQGIPELIEANIGTNYSDYCERAGFSKHFVYNSQLPEKIRGGSRKIGVDNKGIRNLYIIDKMRECVKSYYKNIYFDVVFRQLDTFVQKVTTKSETWESLDKIAYFDDVLFALTFAYINSEFCHDHISAKEEAADEVSKSRIKYLPTRLADGTLTRVPKMIKIA